MHSTAHLRDTKQVSLSSVGPTPREADHGNLDGAEIAAARGESGDVEEGSEETLSIEPEEPEDTEVTRRGRGARNHQGHHGVSDLRVRLQARSREAEAVLRELAETERNKQMGKRLRVRSGPFAAAQGQHPLWPSLVCPT